VIPPKIEPSRQKFSKTSNMITAGAPIFNPQVDFGLPFKLTRPYQCKNPKIEGAI
jgi:hypothetical protein